MKPEYEPKRSELPGGAIALDYGEAHAARQRDAEELLGEISWADSAVVTTVRCRKGHELATVYRTSPMVIRIDPTTHRGADIRQVSRQLGVKVTAGESIFCDILPASEDRDLESRCRCGNHELERHDILAAARSAVPLHIVD